jgi:peptidoglycan/xylan/chitin deacetylase (PgdA/CDA1 family)
MLVFAAALADVAEGDLAAQAERLKVKNPDLPSIKRVSDRLFARLVENWAHAAEKCAGKELFCAKAANAGELAAAGHALDGKVPDAYAGWLANARAFHRNYAVELMRLAALFPRVSSEIDTYSPIEHDGFELADRHFQLTFDDGPTAAGGSTDALLPILVRSGLHTTFYMLGERLKARLAATDAKALAQAFEGQCAALHGWEHQPHAKWEKWQASVTDTRDLVKQTFPAQYQPLFRPPYGQRKSDSGEFFTASGLEVALWNIDSQDWNKGVSGDDAAQRVMTLMLVWRRGVILFHDVHAKALTAVPWLVEHGKPAGVVWDDCRNYLKTRSH